MGINEDVAKEMVLDQDIDQFWEVLKKKQREYWLKEEYLCSYELEIPRLKQDMFNELASIQDDETNKSRPRLQGVHNYDILSNPFYCDKYLYTPNAYP